MYIGDFSRRMYAAMVAAMDEGLGNLSATLHATGLVNRTIIVHTNDNGGMSGTYGMRCCRCGTSCGGLNYPYRGWKDSAWEGGFRGLGLLYAPAFLPRPGREYEPLLWVGDWYKTLVLGAALANDNAASAAAARTALAPLLRAGPIDSIDHWMAIRSTSDATLPPPRTEILLAGVDIVAPWSRRGAIRVGRYKLILGDWGDPRWCDLNRSGFSPAYPAPRGNAFLGLDGGEGGLVCIGTLADSTNANARVVDDPVEGQGVELSNEAAVAPPPQPPPLPWSDLVSGLYDIEADPREQHDLSAAEPGVVAKLLKRMLQLNSTGVAPSVHLPEDPAGTRHAAESNCWQPWM